MPSMSSGRKSWASSVLTSTTSPVVNCPLLQPQTVKPIAPAIIRLVISDWPMLSQASEVSLHFAVASASWRTASP